MTIEPLLMILKPILRSAEEAEATGLHTEALPFAISQFNAVLALVRQRTPDDPVWSVLTPLDPERHNCAALALACQQLLEVAAGTAKKETCPCWQVNKDTTITSCYEGSIVVEPGCRLTLLGSVEGDVTLRPGARLDLKGVVEGDVEAEPGSVVDVFGTVEGTVRLYGNARLDVKGIIEGDVEADPESRLEYLGSIEGSVRTRKTPTQPAEGEEATAAEAPVKAASDE